MTKKNLMYSLLVIILGISGINTACTELSESDTKPNDELKTESNSDVSFLKEDMAYVDARKLLIEHGWRPLSFEVNEKENILPSCLQRFSGCTVNDKDEYCLEAIEICKQFPEFETWSSEGYVMMIFENNETRLYVTIFGDGKNSINPTELNVTGWRLANQQME